MERLSLNGIQTIFIKMHKEDNLNFGEVRSYHSLNSGLYVLVNRERYRAAGFTDEQIDRIAIICMAHSKSTSGVRDLNSKADWKECFDRLDSVTASWNADHARECKQAVWEGY